MEVRAVILVEGPSDEAAIEVLARRRGRDLAAEGVRVVSMGGARSIRRFLERYGPHGENLRVAGLCDANEEGDFRRGLERAGLGAQLSRAEMEALGFGVCDADLEDELIRALGAERVKAVIEAEGDLPSFRALQQQPAQRERTTAQQLRRFMGTRSGRKVLYGRVLVEALDLEHVPRPLELVLAHA